MTETINTEQEITYRFSWLAYVKPTIIFFFMMMFGYGLAFGEGSEIISLSIGWFLLVAGILYFYCAIKYRREFKIVIDKDGVWVYSGIFPWTKGRNGTQWRNIDDAIYITHIISWATKSYKIRIGHRFTKSSELIIPHVRDGNNAVSVINETLMEKVDSLH